MLFSGNLNFAQNPLLAMSILKGDNTSELSKLALLNGNNPNGLNNMLGLEGYSGFGKKISQNNAKKRSIELIEFNLQRFFIKYSALKVILIKT